MKNTRSSQLLSPQAISYKTNRTRKHTHSITTPKPTWIKHNFAHVSHRYTRVTLSPIAVWYSDNICEIIGDAPFHVRRHPFDVRQNLMKILKRRLERRTTGYETYNLVESWSFILTSLLLRRKFHNFYSADMRTLFKERFYKLCLNYYSYVDRLRVPIFLQTLHFL